MDVTEKLCIDCERGTKKKRTVNMAATIKDIAKATGLGLATISSYLNGGNVREKNRIRIEQAIEELHFEVNEVARGLKTNRTRSIGILIPELNNIFCAEIITEAEEVLRRQGYAAMICDCRTDAHREKEAIDFLLHRRVDGLLMIPSGETGASVQRFLRAKKPVVLIDRKIRNLDCDCVLVDNKGAVKDAVNRLITAGHREIGIIAGPEEMYTAQERLYGYEQALAKARIPIRDSLMVRGDYTIRGGMKAMRELIQKNTDLSAVLVSNYEMTLGSVIELHELGVQIPEELSLIGFDNVEFARASTPRLSIVTQPTKEIGKKAAELMLLRLQEDTVSGKKQKLRLKTGFVEGNSVRDIKREESLERTKE